MNGRTGVYSALFFLLVMFTALNSSITTQQYKVPQPYNLIVAIILIIAVVAIGIKFIKNVLTTILIFVVLFILASVAYSFFTTGALTLSGVSGFIGGIVSFLKEILGVSHAVSNTVSNVSKAGSNIPYS
ncbi:MAG: hypothetical protein LVQ97_03000 [Candidatus Micrarchaeales archaeon]|jgi:membrane-bound ClpP family serine protease|nr:hypothetical protein [Candidatus Micrarchaeales archaeon]